MSAPLLLVPHTEALTDASVAAYAAHYRFAALTRALALPPLSVIAEIEAAGLRGRGGAAFPTGRKWRLVHDQPERERYVVANGEEGEPGAFKDRYLLERDPLRVLEGMLIAAHAVSARTGFVYLNHHYRAIGAVLESLCAWLRANGRLGRDALGAGRDFDIEMRRARAAYVSGEETALFQAIEGRRAEPTGRPPFPTERGLFGKPTAINNVETFASIPLILELGARGYAAIGCDGSYGPKLFSVSGDVRAPGVIEEPLGVTLRALLARAGGVDGAFKCAFVSGPSGTLWTAADLDRALTIEHGVGNGAVIVCNDTRSALELVRALTDFFVAEHCGRCLPGRAGMQTLARTVAALEAGAAPAPARAAIEQAHALTAAAGKCALCPSATAIVPKLIAAFPEDFGAAVVPHERHGAD
jgi:NADH-quinone oxidoreductase subunit F